MTRIVGQFPWRRVEPYGFEIVLRDGVRSPQDMASLRRAVGERALRLQRLTHAPNLDAPWSQPDSAIRRDDNRGMAHHHGDLTVEFQANSRLMSAFDHLTSQAEGWLVKGELPPFRIYPEFTVLRGALEAASAVWWILEPPDSSQRVLRALASKKQESFFEAKATKLKVGSQASEQFEEVIAAALKEAAQEVGAEGVPKFPTSTKLVDGFGGGKSGGAVGLAWRECSSYAHGFDWAAYHHRAGDTLSRVPFEILGEMFWIACDALDEVWTRKWLPLATTDSMSRGQEAYLPSWPGVGRPPHGP